MITELATAVVGASVQRTDRDPEQIILQFSFSNRLAVPVRVRTQKPETEGEFINRHGRSSGQQVIGSEDGCCIGAILCDIESSGYKLVDAFKQDRIDPRDPNRARTYHMVRFVFARREIVQLDDVAEELMGHAREELVEMIKFAFWRAQVYRNPFYQDGEVVAGKNSMSINLAARKPLCDHNRQPILVWQKDANGERIGDAALPLVPNQYLRMIDGEIRLG